MNRLIGLEEIFKGKLPIGTIGEIYGAENCGKTTFAIELTKLFKSTFYLETENKFDREYANSIGFKCKTFFQPDTFEEGIDKFYELYKKVWEPAPMK